MAMSTICERCYQLSWSKRHCSAKTKDNLRSVPVDWGLLYFEANCGLMISYLTSLTGVRGTIVVNDDGCGDHGDGGDDVFVNYAIFGDTAKTTAKSLQKIKTKSHAITIFLCQNSFPFLLSLNFVSVTLPSPSPPLPLSFSPSFPLTISLSLFLFLSSL